MNGSSGFTSTSSVRSGISSRTSMNGIARVREDAELRVDVQVDRRGLDARRVERVDHDAPGVDARSRMSRSDRIIGGRCYPVRNLDPRSSVFAASPSSIAPAAVAIPSARSAANPATSSAAPALRSTTSRRGPGSPSGSRACDVGGRPPGRRPRDPPAAPAPSPSSAGSRWRLAHRAVLDVEDGGDARRRELVEPVLAAEQLRAGAAPREHLGHERQHPLVGARRRPARTGAPGS